jgi:hypothetical protein
LVTVHFGKIQIQEYEIGAWGVDVSPFALQKGKRFFTISDDMRLVRASRVAKGREREVGIRRIVLNQQNLNGSLGHASPFHLLIG